MKKEADSPETVVAGVRHGVVVWNKPSLRVPDVRQHRWVELLLLLLYLLLLLLLLLLLHSLLLLHLLHLFLLLLEKESILAAPQCKIRLGLLPRSGAFPLLTLCSKAKKKKLYIYIYIYMVATQQSFVRIVRDAWSYFAEQVDARANGNDKK